MASEVQTTWANVERILSVSRLYMASDDPWVQQQQHQTAETVRQELAESGHLGLAMSLGEDKTLAQKEAVAKAWRKEMISLGASFDTASGLAAPDRTYTDAEEPGAPALQSTLIAAGQATGNLLSFFTGSSFLKWVPWLLGIGAAARIFKIKLNLGGKR